MEEQSLFSSWTRLPFFTLNPLFFTSDKFTLFLNQKTLKDMDNLLFYLLLAILIYYFYTQTSKKPANSSPRPFKHQSTQTDPETTKIETEPGPTRAELPDPKTLNGPPALTLEDQTALEQTLDTLIKSMTDLSRDLDKM